MGYKLRFVQTFDKKEETRFLELEKNFILLEERAGELTPGRRYVPVTGRQPTNTLVWEADFPSLEEAVACLNAIEGNAEHDRLLEEQVGAMRDAYVEIYRQL